VLVGLALTVGLAWVLGGRMLRRPWSADYLFRKAQRVVLERADAIVDVHDPDAIFVEVIPRRNWGQVALQTAEDVGFLRLDFQQHEMLIEGDNKRYQAPRGAVVACSVELMNPAAAEDPRGVPQAVVVLTVRADLGERELPLRPVRTISGDALGGNYVERAHELHRRIGACLQLQDANALATP
jgi:hypothetical protein